MFITNSGLTCDVSAPASQHNLDRTLVNQGKVHVSLLVHADGAEIQDRLTRRRGEKLEIEVRW